MELVAFLVLGVLIVGAGLALRERRTGRGKILDDRPHHAPQTEAGRERIRAEGDTLGRHSFGGQSGDGDGH